jgi:hypothetical protein
VDLQDADGDGICDGNEIIGCQDSEACNYDSTATDAGTCVLADENCEICNAQGGVDLQDADGDGVCDGDEIVGCQNTNACNYDSTATDAGTCVFADGNCEVCNTQGGVDVQDADGDGVCDGDEIVGCQDSNACNYDENATDAGSCDYDCVEEPAGCASDLNNSGVVGVEDLLLLLADFGCVSGNCSGDVNDDGITGVSDILVLLSSFSVEGCNVGG